MGKDLMDGENVNSAAFWADEECFVAGEWEGKLPDLSTVQKPVLFRTSGSSGEPKWVVLEKRALIESATAVNCWLGVSNRSKWGLALPDSHVGGFGVMARAFQAGCGLSIGERKWSAPEFAAWVEREAITHVSLVPTQVHDLVKEGLRGAPGLEAVVVGGGCLAPEPGQAARDSGWPVLASYGMTETCSQVATQEIGSLPTRFADSPMMVLPVWEAGVSSGGLLRLKGKALFSGIVERKRGEWVFTERKREWFTTEDRVSLVGDQLVHAGRADLLVKVMGELVDIGKVEREILQISSGRTTAAGFAVVPIKDLRKENSLVAVFEEKEGFTEEIFRKYNLAAPGTERLARWFRISRLPRSPLGKLKRGELRKICEELEGGSPE